MKENKLAEAIGNLDEKYINEAELYQRKVRKLPKAWMGVTAMAACFLLVCGIGFARFDKKTDSVVCIDVNPSIEITVNKKDEVRKAVALNEDAEIVLADMDLRGVDLSVALNAIMGSLYKNGYLDDVYNAVNVCVENDDTERASQLGDLISTEISSILDEQDVIGEVNALYCVKDKETKQQAADYEISVGKLILAQKVASHMNMTVAEAAELSIEELWDLLDAESVTLLTKEEALQIAAKHAGVEVAMLTEVEQKVQETAGIYVHIVKFTVGGNREYEYKLNAVDGTVITCDSKYVLKEEMPEIPNKGTPPVQPTATPEIIPTPTASPTRAPEEVVPTAAPTQAPEATPTLAPSPAPEATATPAVTPTKAPEATATPTVTPTMPPEIPDKGTPPVEPTATPTVSPTKAPEEAVTPTAVPTKVLKPTKVPKPTEEPKPTKIPLPEPEKPKKEYTKKEALAVVYRDAAVEEKDAKLTKLQHMPKEKQYHIKFSVGLCDYVYDISSVDGSIVSKEVTDHTVVDGTGGLEQETVLTEDVALNLALAKAGVSFSQLTKCEVKYNAKKDGKEYKIHFHVDKDHYEYIVDAVTGAITEKATPGPATPEKPVPPHEKGAEKEAPVGPKEKEEDKKETPVLPHEKEETGKVTPAGPKK